MKLSISNIGWGVEKDRDVYLRMAEYGFAGLEIAPTRIFPQAPYDNLNLAEKWKDELQLNYGFVVSSMQSIWYGRSERLFGSEDEREFLLKYTKKAIDFAETIGCKNLVFGCPKNRCIPENGDEEIAVRFFKALGDYAYQHHTVLAMEANPPIYQTNFLNTTSDAITFIERVDSKGFLLNLDMGTMIENGEGVEVLKEKAHLINHVHISEPGLKQLQQRKLHAQLAEYLRDVHYERYVSIEVGRQDHFNEIEDMLNYVSHVFG